MRPVIGKARRPHSSTSLALNCESFAYITIAPVDAQQATDLLRRHGMRSTAAARHVLLMLAGLPIPATARILHASQRSRRMDLATIHRILVKGVQNGLFRTIRFRDRSHWYELAADHTHHHHLFCTHCRRIERFRYCVLEDLQAEALREKGFTVLSHSLELYGTCRNCQSPAKNPGR